MTQLTDDTISVLRALHDDLAAFVTGLTDEELGAQSGAAEWTVADTVSHLGSSAEIGAAGYRAAHRGEEAPGQDFNQAVWDRWDALSPRAQAHAYVEHGETLVAMLEGLGTEERDALTVKLAFLPDAVSLDTIVGMRLSEAAHHGWDIHVGLDPAATLDARAAELLADHHATSMAFLLGFSGKAEALSEPATVRVTGSDVRIVIGNKVSVTRSSGETTTATFDADLEAAMRLLTGRLDAEHTPKGLEVSGNVSLDDLRRVFPGY